MKNRSGLAVFFIVFMCYCNPNSQGEKSTGILSNLINLSDNEDKGIKEVLAFYGGYCEYGIEKKIYTDKDNETNFWIKLSKSASVDSLATIAELSGSNIAYIFFKNLAAKERKYNNIQSELIFGDGNSMKFIYTVAQLEKVEAKVRVVEKIVDLIKNKSFKEIKNYLNVDTSLLKYDKDVLVSNLENAEPEFGNASNFIPYGFIFSKAENGQELLHISGLIKRDKLSNYFSVDLDPNSLKDEVFSLNYRL